MRDTASILHIDLDAFFAAVEQRDKPSLRGKPVVVGGVAGRGVVATASYEARAFGVRSAMSTHEARARCSHAAFLSPRFAAYQRSSRIVMEHLRTLSPLVEPLSLDEAFVDLAVATGPNAPADLSLAELTRVATELRAHIEEATGGLTASVGLASSKFLAKIASELNKPDGLSVIAPGTELEVLRPMKVRVIPGVGPATDERLRRAGIHTVADLEALDLAETIRIVGRAQGESLHAMARAQDNRAVVAERETKSVSVEDTYTHDVTDRDLMADLLTRQARGVAERLARQQFSGRTVTVKVRLYDFSTTSRSQTLPAPTDDPAVIARTARALLGDIDTIGGVRLLGVGVSGLADWVQEELFPSDGLDPDENTALPEQSTLDAAAPVVRRPEWPPGSDVVHDEMGAGWVWGSGRGVVTVRFESALTGPGPVRSYRVDDPALRPAPVTVDEETADEAATEADVPAPPA